MTKILQIEIQNYLHERNNNLSSKDRINIDDLLNQVIGCKDISLYINLKNRWDSYMRGNRI